MHTLKTFIDYLRQTDTSLVQPLDFYRTIFAEGELEKAGQQEEGKYNAIIETPHSLVYVHDDLSSIPDYEQVYSACMNYIGYAGQSGEDHLARELHAFTIRVEFPEHMTWHTLFDLFNRHARGSHPRICPTFITTDGGYVYFVYVLDEPIPMYDKFLKKLAALYNTLARNIHRAFEEACFCGCKKPRQKGLYGRYPVIGTIHNGEICDAYRTGDMYSLNDINALLPKAQRLDYHKSKVSLEEAQLLWPNWHQYRVEQKRKSTGRRTWELKPQAYNWFLEQVNNNFNIVKPGVLQALASYALKAKIPANQFVRDLDSLAQKLLGVFSEETVMHHFSTAIDISDNEPGRMMYWSLSYIEKLSGLTLPRNDRKYRTRAEHLKKLHNSQSKKKAVHKWQLSHPNGTRAECARALGITWDTAHRWWKTDKEPAEKVSKKNIRICSCGCSEFSQSTLQWFWSERGNYYKRQQYICTQCNAKYLGRARIDNAVS